MSLVSCSSGLSQNPKIKRTILYSTLLQKIGYRGIQQMMYQPKSVGKMVDFEKLALSISLNSNQICTYFCKDLVTGYSLGTW